jgi:hypothetical protein
MGDDFDDLKDNPLYETFQPRGVPAVGERGHVADETSDRPRLVSVDKERAAEFIEQHHSKLPDINYRGLMYTIGVMVGSRLVAVGAAGHPSARWEKRSEQCSTFGMLELSRIASDGTVRGASSMIAARMIDLLPFSGRHGVPGCLFLTYSLLTERGTTYLALADKGLRPVAISKRHVPGGARSQAGMTALRGLDKVRWEAGPAAMPPNWDLLLAAGVPQERLDGARKAFAAWEQREARRLARPAARSR